MVSCTETRWYQRYRRVAAVIWIAGGAAIIAVAILLRSDPSIPLGILGLAWVAFGVHLAAQGRRLIRKIVVTGATVQFMAASGTTSLMAADVVEVSRSRFDQRQMGAITFLTTSGTKLRAVPRLDGLFDVLTAMGRANPALNVRGV